jgi:hypothetical protein
MLRHYIKFAGALALVAAIAFAWAACSSSHARFVAAERVPAGISLRFEGPLAKVCQENRTRKEIP